MKKEAAIEFFGGISAVADALGIRPASVSEWGEYVPEGRAYQLQVITGGRLLVDKSAYTKRPALDDLPPA